VVNRVQQQQLATALAQINRSLGPPREEAISVFLKLARCSQLGR
jgi:hypothetical protein